MGGVNVSLFLTIGFPIYSYYISGRRCKGVHWTPWSSP